jgi:hypothetical protein
MTNKVVEPSGKHEGGKPQSNEKNLPATVGGIPKMPKVKPTKKEK